MMGVRAAPGKGHLSRALEAPEWPLCVVAGEGLQAQGSQ